MFGWTRSLIEEPGETTGWSVDYELPDRNSTKFTAWKREHPRKWGSQTWAWFHVDLWGLFYPFKSGDSNFMKDCNHGSRVWSCQKQVKNASYSPCTRFSPCLWYDWRNRAQKKLKTGDVRNLNTRTSRLDRLSQTHETNHPCNRENTNLFRKTPWRNEWTRKDELTNTKRSSTLNELQKYREGSKPWRS